MWFTVHDTVCHYHRGRELATNEIEWTRKAEIRKEEFLTLGDTCQAIFWCILRSKAATWIALGSQRRGSLISASALPNGRRLRRKEKLVQLINEPPTHSVRCKIATRSLTPSVGGSKTLSVKSERTGQTTVNKKTPIHYKISTNDMVYRPLWKCLKKSPKNSTIRPSNLIYCGWI